jgi:hypothetical protein
VEEDDKEVVTDRAFPFAYDVTLVVLSNGRASGGNIGFPAAVAVLDPTNDAAERDDGVTKAAVVDARKQQ